MTDYDDKKLIASLRPVNGYVLVRLGKTAAGSRHGTLVIASTARKKTNIGKVEALPGDVDPGSLPRGLTKGAYVVLRSYSMRPVFQSSSMYEFFNERNRYVMVHPEDILAVVEKDNEGGTQ